MSYTFLNALQSLWGRHERADRMMASWKSYAETHKNLQEQYTKKFSTHMKNMHEHMKKGDPIQVREHYKKHLEDLGKYFESALDAHLDLVGTDPKHADRLLDHHNAVAQKLVESMPITKSIYEKMQKNPAHQRRKRVASKITMGSLGVMAGLMSSVMPTKSADATRVDVMRMNDFDLDKAFKARDAAFKRSQKTTSVGKTAQVTPEMQEAFGQFIKSFVQNNMDMFKGMFMGQRGENTQTNVTLKSQVSIPRSKTLPVLEAVTETQSNIPAPPPPMPLTQKLEDKGARPTLKTGFIDVLKELKDKFAEKNKRLFHNKDIRDLNQITTDLEKTATGSYLKYMYPGKDMETALGLAVGNMLKLIQKDAKVKNRIASDAIVKSLEDDFEGVKNEVVDLTREILKSSVAYGPDYTAFYHGHGNSLRLYLDMLREIKGYENIADLNSTNPLRDKGQKTDIANAQDLLSRYEDEAMAFQKRVNQEAKLKDPNAKEIELFDTARTLGVGFAPDKIDFFRDHAISANINLFGNMHVLAECTLFYFLDSFNISNPNEALVKNLLSRITPEGAPDGYVDARMKRYADLYNEHMKESGGNLMQIFIKNTPDEDDGSNLVDEITFPAWMKGIPIWESRDTGKLATVSNNFDAVPVLSNKNKLFKRVKTTDYMDLFTSDPNAFINKYSNFSKVKNVQKRHRMASYDRPQVRIFVDPKTFNDGKNVIVEQYTRSKIGTSALDDYQRELKKLIKEDMDLYLEGLQKGTSKGSEGDRLTKLVELMKQGQAFEEANNAYGTSSDSNNVEPAPTVETSSPRVIQVSNVTGDAAPLNLTVSGPQKKMVVNKKIVAVKAAKKVSTNSEKMNSENSEKKFNKTTSSPNLQKKMLNRKKSENKVNQKVSKEELQKTDARKAKTVKKYEKKEQTKNNRILSKRASKKESKPTRLERKPLVPKNVKPR